ncbi:MAG: DUF3352 domain-containing protein [Bryobacteraceae bacterium]|nr:DUF3352 domain-containing protein [Bryobacteraceae bacterium]MDW8379946.1 hypothetical protein [Bryobacterales bacterium]
MNRFRSFLFLLVLASTTCWAADPALLKLLPPDPKWIAGIHADRVRSSRFGQFVLEQLKSEEQVFERLVSSTGFDPRRDLQEVIVASPESKSQGFSLVVARGSFDAARIREFARSLGLSANLYQGVELLASPDTSPTGCLAILDATTALAGHPEAVKAAIDRRSKDHHFDPKILAKLNDLSTRYDAWMVSAGLERLASELRPELEQTMRSPVMAGFESVVGGIRFGANVELMAEGIMRSDKDAQALVDVMRFLTSLVQLNSENSQAKELGSWLERMTLKAEGKEFRLLWTVPENLVEAFLRESFASPAKSMRRPSTPVI